MIANTCRACGHEWTTEGIVFGCPQCGRTDFRFSGSIDNATLLDNVVEGDVHPHPDKLYEKEIEPLVQNLIDACKKHRVEYFIALNPHHGYPRTTHSNNMPVAYDSVHDTWHLGKR